MNKQEREQLLGGLGLSTDGDSLAPQVETPSVEDDDARFTTPVSEIVFDPSILAGFQLDKTDIADAKRLIDRTYRKGKNRDRAVALNAKADVWIRAEKARRNGTSAEPSGVVRKRVKADRETLDLADTLRKAGITAADLAKMIADKQS